MASLWAVHACGVWGRPWGPARQEGCSGRASGIAARRVRGVKPPLSKSCNRQEKLAYAPREVRSSVSVRFGRLRWNRQTKRSSRSADTNACIASLHQERDRRDECALADALSPLYGRRSEYEGRHAAWLGEPLASPRREAVF